MGKLGSIVLVAALAVAGCSRTDDRVNEQVKARLADEPTPMAQLQVSTKDRIVTLSGVVATEDERARIERIVRDMDEVLGVDNRLMVQRPVHVTGEAR